MNRNSNSVCADRYDNHSNSVKCVFSISHAFHIFIIQKSKILSVLFISQKYNQIQQLAIRRTDRRTKIFIRETDNPHTEKTKKNRGSTDIQILKFCMYSTVRAHRA